MCLIGESPSIWEARELQVEFISPLSPILAERRAGTGPVLSATAVISYFKTLPPALCRQRAPGVPVKFTSGEQVQIKKKVSPTRRKVKEKKENHLRSRQGDRQKLYQCVVTTPR